MKTYRHAGATLVAFAMVLVGAGAALAASGADNRGERCEARLLARIDRAETAGRIAPERADRLRERIDAGNVCERGHVRTRITALAMLRVAAGFLDLDRAELRTQLPGTSLAGLAEKQGKSAADLKVAMLAPAKARLAKAVTNRRIGRMRADRMLERLELLADRLATRVVPRT